MDNLTKLRYWTFKILPLVYDDSLSYYEVLAKVTAKVNELVNSNNTMPQAITDEITKQLDESYATDINNKINSAVNTVTENANNQIDKLANEVYAKLITAIATNEETNAFTVNNKSGGELIFLNGTLYKVIAVMPAGTNYIIGTNIVPVDISKELKNIKNVYINSNNEYWNDRSANNYDTNTYIYWKDNLYVTTKDIKINDILYNDGINQNIKQVTLASEISKHYNDIKQLQTEQSAQSTRIDNIIAHAGDANTEIVDARIGYNGIVYSTLGTAIRTQVKDINDDLINLDLIATEKDFVINNGKYINSGSLNFNDSPNYGYTNPFLLKKGNKIVISTKGSGTLLSVLTLCDENNENRINLIRSIDSEKHEYSYIAPVDMYITISVATDDYAIRIYKPNINDSKAVEKSILGFNSPIKIEKVRNMIIKNSYTEHTNYVCSKPIKMLKGQKLETNIRCESNVSAISKVKEDGTILQSISNGKGNMYLPYEYIAGEDCYIVVCFYVERDSNNEFNGVVYYPTYENLERIYYDSIDRMSFSMFENFGVIGDSFASGVFFDKAKNKLENHLNKSWGQILARKSGNICTNFSKGGLYCGEWLTDTDRGLPYLLQESAKELYIIALGINDVSKLSGIQPLGTIADINTNFSQNPNSFYGNYGKIIGNIKQHAPNAKIIITTIPYTGEGAMQINNAIVDIAKHYELPCLKLHMNTFFQSSYFWNNMYDNHPKSFMYGAMANEYERMICNDIKANTAYWGDTFN